MNGWTLAKYVLMLAGVALILVGENLQLRWLGFAGLVPIIAAFLLRFVQRKFDPERKDSATSI